MINENKIKSAAQAYCDATYGTLDNHPLIADAFKQGAKYAINEFLKEEIKDEFRKVEASMRCNKKGWGNDYFQYITIEPLYTEAE